MNKTRTFGGIEPEFAGFDSSSILLQSIPYDGTSTWGKGADKGFEAFMEASENMELYDIETDSEVYRKGVHLVDPVLEKSSPEELYKAVLKSTRDILKTGKFPTFIGGEHSVSMGIIDAFAEQHKNLTVLQLDAHADLRPAYLGTEFNHACAMHRASKSCNLIQVGIRSMDMSEKEHMDLEKTYFAQDIYDSKKWMKKSIEQMTDQVYISIDLDVFDPAVMPATGTPEPGGMDWNTVLYYLKKVFKKKEVVGFDIVEFSPIEGLSAPGFLVSKLYYKLLSYKFHGRKG